MKKIASQISGHSIERSGMKTDLIKAFPAAYAWKPRLGLQRNPMQDNPEKMLHVYLTLERPLCAHLTKLATVSSSYT